MAMRLRSKARRPLATVYPSRARPALPHEAALADRQYGRVAHPDWRTVDWPRHVGDNEVAGLRMRYADLGKGEPAVVFVHGLGGNWQSWLENLPCTATERRAIAMDLPGFGMSEVPAGGISIPALVGWVNELCERLCLGRVALVGNSMGGLIAAEMAIAYPHRVERLALVAAAGISTATLRRRPTLTAGALGALVGALTAARNREFIARPRLRHLALSTVVRHPSRLRPELLSEIVQGSGRPTVLPALEAILDYDIRHRLSRIRCPTLLVWGSEDILVPVEDAEEFERLIPNTRTRVLPDTGHCPMLERPEAFNAMLMEFLGEDAASGPPTAS